MLINTPAVLDNGRRKCYYYHTEKLLFVRKNAIVVIKIAFCSEAEKVFKKTAFSSRTFRHSAGSFRNVNADKDGVVTDNLDIVPADADILLLAEKTEAAAFAPNND